MHESLKIAFLPKALHESILEEAASYFPRETGGILMGFYSPSREGFITEIVGPGPAARHGRYNFDPDNAFQRERVASIYAASGRIHTYLGDWHTHPLGYDRLSPMDIDTLREIAGSEEARCPDPLMLLVVGGPK